MHEMPKDHVDDKTQKVWYSVPCLSVYQGKIQQVQFYWCSQWSQG